MEKFRIIQAYGEKQKAVITKLFEDIRHLDVSVYENQYVFALKAQQLYTAIEDYFKSIAATFENSIDNHARYHLELLRILSVDIPEIRPAVISEKSFLLLDKLRAFRHFIRHGYNYILDPDELTLLQKKFIPRQQELIQKKIIGQIYDFGQDIQLLGERSFANSLVLYGKEIKMNADSFETEILIDLLQDLPNQIKILKQQLPQTESIS